MPEGPEIRLAADALAAVLNDQIVEEIEFGQAPLKKYESELAGQTISRVKRHKHLFPQSTLRCLEDC
jgi:endonuclease-8